MRKQQEDYQRSRNPFEFGQQVARRRYSAIMSGLDAQRQATQRSYGDMYQAARQRAVGQQAMGGPTLSGGMGQQRRDYVSALEMQELGKIGAARAQAEADLYTQGQSAFSNAQLEGQQAAQQELANRTAQLQMVQQRQAILADKKLTDEQKQEQLNALGGIESAQGITPQGNQGITSGDVLTGAGIGAAGLYGIPKIIKGGTALKATIGAGKAFASGLGAKGLATGVTAASKGLAGTIAKAAIAKGAVASGLTAKTAISTLGFKGLIGLTGKGVGAAGVKLGAMKALGLLAVANPVGAILTGVVAVGAVIGIGMALFGK